MLLINSGDIYLFLLKRISENWYQIASLFL
jgi:hypothetical protein